MLVAILDKLQRRPKFQSHDANKQDFINDPDHQWIFDDYYLKRVFMQLLDILPANDLDKLIKSKSKFLKTSGLLSITIKYSHDHAIVLIYPELEKMLKTVLFENGLAVLLHEIGHIIYDHALSKKSILTAQVEADDYAFNLGLGRQLHDVLLEHDRSVDTLTRVAILTSKLYTM